MKKIFTLLTAILLCSGTGRALDLSWTASQFMGGTLVGYDGSNVVYYYNWGSGNPYTSIVVCFVTANGVSLTANNKTFLFPPAGTYQISGSEGAGKVGRYQTANNYAWVYNSSRYCSFYNNGSGTQYKYYTGNIVFEEGNDGPYVHGSGLQFANNAFNQVMNGTHSVTCGTAATYYNVTVQANNNSYGTATPSYKSGYVYANNRSQEYKKNSVYTITATPNSGYRFVCWKKNGTQISTDATTDVQITGDATYTAYFESNSAPQYTITTAVSPSNTYGTVTGAGSYYENNPATLTATSANEHLYIFDHWLKDGNNYAGGTTITPTVTAAATYTAVFRNAAEGTITGVANYGTISGTGHYTGGSAVTLTVTPNSGYSFTQWSDGNTDNPRTVYVDGNKNYTAEFMYGVSLNLLAGCSPSSPLEYRVLLPDYEIYFRAGNDWSYGDGEEIPLSYINTSASYIKDHGTTVTIGNDVYAYTHTEGDRKILELNFTGSNGKYYQILLRGANYATDCDQNFDQTFTNLTTASSGTGWRILSADNGVTTSAANAFGGPDHWDIMLPVYIDESKCGSENDGVPSGIYPILDTNEAGTARATTANNDIFANGYWLCQGIDQRHKLVTGYMDVVNRDGNTYAEINGYTSSCYPLHCVAKSSSSVGVPVTINCTAGEGGSANIVWHSANCGDVTYTAVDMPQKFFNGNTITLTATANSGYEFWRWSDEDASVKTSAYGASRNVTVSGNLTLQAIFREEATNHTVTITAPTNGTITVSYNDGSAQSFTSGSRSIEEGTELTVTTTPAADYHFGAWTGNGAASVTVDGAKTIGATFAQNDYFLNATYGAHGASVTRGDDGNSSTVKRAGNTVTLSATAENGYEFLAWAGDDAEKISNNVFTFPTNGTHNTTYNVQATFQAITYNISYEGLNGATNSNPATYTIETATFALADPGTRDGYTFTGWTCGGNPITQITLGSTGDKTITANWEEVVTAFDLEDNHEAGDDYYDDYAALVTAGNAIDITYKRSFKAGRWATFSLPFGYSFQTHSEDNPFKDQVFELTSVDYADGRMVINCVKNSTGIVANKPYILIPTSDIDNPTFEGVTPKAIAAGSKTVNNTKDDVYTVEFISTAYKQVMPTGKRTIYISGNRLYYANVDTDIPAFRGYFNLKGGDDVLHIQPRLVIAAPDGETIEQAEEAVAETRKYIENGILVIERNGIKYDAQGHIIK